MAIIKVILAFILSFSQVMAPVAGFIDAKGESAYFTKWSPRDEFTEEACITIEKDPNKDFVILNITDMQMSADEAYGEMGEQTEALITKLVEEQKPDLITLTGDNAWSTMAYIRLVEFFEQLQIPWAPIMGNHDGQGCMSEFWAAELLSNAEYCLFQFGPEDMGYGNYIINIKENGKIIHTLFMTDTHSKAEYTLEDGSVISGYDHLWYNQIRWYKWAVNGIKDIEGDVVESTVFMHIPVVEYEDAYLAAWDEENQVFRPEYAKTSYGVNREGVSPAPVNNHFFDTCKELGSTKNIICGHDHVNNTSILYEGIRLTYALKAGAGCYYDPELTGGTTVTINSAGNASIRHNYVDMSTLS